MSNLILITGDDTIAIKSNATKIAFAEKKSLDDEFSFEVIAGDDENTTPQKTLENLIISLNTPSFFGSTKVIWLKHFSHFKSLTGQTGTNKDFQDFFKSISDTLKSGALEDGSLKFILDGSALDKRSAFFKFCSKHGKVLEFNKIKSSDKSYQLNLRNKITSLCESENVNIKSNAIEFLSEAVGSDTGRLSTEISKLCSYISGTTDTITVEHCHEICTKTIEMANWIFAESLADRNIKQSIYSLNILIENLMSDSKSGNNPELTMFFSASRKFQEIIKTKKATSELSIPMQISYNSFKDILQSNSDATPNNSLINMHPYRAYMLHKQASNFSESELPKIFTELLNANKEFVSGNTTPRILLENLIFKICGRRRK
jgi:DNA polymerase III subunit delta